MTRFGQCAVLVLTALAVGYSIAFTLWTLVVR